MGCSTLGSSVFHYLPEFAQIHVHWVDDTIEPSHPLLPSSSFAFSLSQHPHLFQWVSPLHQVAKYWNFCFSISPSNIQPYFSVDFLWDWLIWSPCSTSSLMLNLLYGPYITTGKTIAWSIWTFVGKMMSLFFNILSRFVIAFLQRSKHVNFMATVTVHDDFGAQENKICHCFHFLPFCLPGNDGTGCHDLSFLNVEIQVSFFTLLLYLH